jgi:hypothetical protein
LCLVYKLYKPPSSELEIRTFWAFVSVTSISKQRTLVLKLFYCAQFPSYRNCPHQDLNSGHFSEILTFLKSLPSLKEYAKLGANLHI